MAINLLKGQKIDIGLSKMTVGLGWNPHEGTGYEFDLDVSAIMIDANRFVPEDEYFVFDNNLDSPDQAVHHTGDDPSGGNSDGGDDESLIVDLTKVNPKIQEILFVVTIHEAQARRQNFGQVRDSYIRILDNSTNAEVCKYELGEDFSIETAIEFGRLYLRNGQWKFEASGLGYKEDLAFFLSKYFKGQIIK